MQSLKGRLELHFLPGYAPDLNPDEFVWNHLRQNGVTKKPLKQNEKLKDRVETDLAQIKRSPRLVRSFFRAESVGYIMDYVVSLAAAVRSVGANRLARRRDGRCRRRPCHLASNSPVSLRVSSPKQKLLGTRLIVAKVPVTLASDHRLQTISSAGNIMP
jgi:hypothetical protein